MPVAPRYVAPGVGAVAAGIGRGVLAGLQQGSAMADADMRRRIDFEQLAAQRRQEGRVVADWLAQGQVPQPFADGDGGGGGRRSGSGGVLGGVGVQDIALEAAEVEAAGPVKGPSSVWGGAPVVGDPMVWGPNQPGMPPGARRAEPRPAVMAPAPQPVVLTPTDPNPLVRRLGWSPENAPEPASLALELRRRAEVGELPANQVPGILDEYADWYARASREAGRRTGLLVQLAEQKAQEQAMAARDQSARAIARENRRRLTATVRSGALPSSAISSDDELLADAYAHLDDRASKVLGENLVGATTDLGKAAIGERGELARVAEDRRQSGVRERNRQAVEDARTDSEFRKIVGGPEFEAMVQAAEAGGMSEQDAEESAVEEARMRAQDRARSVEGVDAAVRDITGTLEPQQAPGASRFVVAPGGSDIQTILTGAEADVGAAFDRAYAMNPSAARVALIERGKTERAAMVGAGSAMPPGVQAAAPTMRAPVPTVGAAAVPNIVLRLQPDGSWLREDGLVVSARVGAAMLDRGVAVRGQ